MRIDFTILALLLGLPSCSLSVGAGAKAAVGDRAHGQALSCYSFESCDTLYRQAVARLERCQRTADDCDDEQQSVAASYGVLREQTELELAALRSDAEQCEQR